MSSLVEACGTRIRHARQLAGITVVELARRVERSPATVFRWEWGVRVPPTESIELLGQVLSVPAAWLAFGLRGLPRPDVRDACRELERAGRAL